MALGNIGSFLAGLSTVAIAIAALRQGPAAVRAWIDRIRAQAEAAREETQTLQLERRRRLSGWNAHGLETYGVTLVTEPAELKRAAAELADGNPTGYVVLRVSESDYDNSNRGRSLRELIKREGYLSRPPSTGEIEALVTGLDLLGIQRAPYGQPIDAQGIETTAPPPVQAKLADSEGSWFLLVLRSPGALVPALVPALCCRIKPYLDQGGSAALRRGPALRRALPWKARPAHAGPARAAGSPDQAARSQRHRRNSAAQPRLLPAANQSMRAWTETGASSASDCVALQDGPVKGARCARVAAAMAQAPPLTVPPFQAVSRSYRMRHPYASARQPGDRSWHTPVSRVRSPKPMNPRASRTPG